MYEAEKELTYLRDFNSGGGDEPRRPDRAVHAFVIFGVCKAEGIGDLPTSQGIDEQGDQPTIRSSAPDRAAVESPRTAAVARCS